MTLTETRPSTGVVCSPEEFLAADYATRRQLVLDQIDLFPAQWEQARWLTESASCGTVGCFAGWACALAGERAGPIDGSLDRHGLSPRGYDVQDRAMALLGLSPVQAYPLFMATNTRDFIAERLALLA